MINQETARNIRREHEIVEKLIDELRQETAVVPRVNLTPWIERLHPKFEHFRAHMTKHMALEEVDGYMVHVAGRLPALVTEIERLGHEHSELMKIMDGIYHSLGALKENDHLLARDCCNRIGDLLSYVEHHEDEEARLLTFAFSQEFGEKD